MTLRISKKALLVLGVLALAATGGTVLAAGVQGVYKGFNIVKVKIDGREVTGDVPAVILDGRTMVPLRVVSEALGATVEWDQASYTVSIQSKERDPGLREGFYVTDKGIGISLASVAAKRDLYGYTAGYGNVFLEVMFVIKNFSDMMHWVAPDTFMVFANDKQYDFSAVTFSNSFNLVPKSVRPNEFTAGIIVFEVPADTKYFAAPGQMLWSLKSLRIPAIPKN